MHERSEIELRVDGVAPGGEEPVRRALEGVDPDAAVRIDGTTGIAHILTRADTLDIVDALRRAGLDATAMTG